MAANIPQAGDVVSFTSPVDSQTHSGIVLRHLNGQLVVAYDFGLSGGRIEWKHEVSIPMPAQTNVVTGGTGHHG